MLFLCQRAHSAQWVGRRSNPRLLVFSQALSRLSYQPNEKGPMSLRHRAFYQEPWQSVDGPVSQAHGIQRERIRRLIGKSRCTFASDGTGPYERHGSFSACLSAWLIGAANVLPYYILLHKTSKGSAGFARILFFSGSAMCTLPGRRDHTAWPPRQMDRPHPHCPGACAPGFGVLEWVFQFWGRPLRA
jgi:hypothetical protein